MKYLTENDFDPDFFHPYYFVRTGLRKGIKENAHYLKGMLLDFGCGSKPYKTMLQVDKYIGIDFENAGHDHEEEEIDVYYDGKKIPFPDQHFDSVLSTEVFEHLFNLEELLGELNRVLKPGGTILFTCPFVWNEHEVPHDYARYTHFSLKHLLNKTGFEVIEAKKAGNFITVLSQMSILYFFNLLFWKANRFLLTRWLYIFFFVFIPNCCGSITNYILPKNTTLYQNNIFVARKNR